MKNWIIWAMVGTLAITGCESNATPSTPTTPPTPSTPEPVAAPVKVEETSTAVSDPKSPGTPEQQDLLAVAKGHFMANELEAARTAFEALVKTGPLSAPKITGYIALGQIYKELGEGAKARVLYAELVRIAPEVPEAHFMHGRALAEARETTAAIRAYEATIRLQPDYLQAYVELGALYVHAGRDEEAQKVFLMYEQRVYGLAKKLEDTKSPVEDRLAVLEVFSFIQDDRASQAIMIALKDPAPEVREQAVVLAEEFGIGEALKHISLMSLGDSDLRVRMAARGALERMEDAPIEGSRPTVVTDPKKLE